MGVEVLLKRSRLTAKPIKPEKTAFLEIRNIDIFRPECELRSLQHIWKPAIWGLTCVAAWLATLLPAAAHGAFHERIDHVSAQITTSPNDARLYLQRADLYRQHQDFKPALADCDKARLLDPAIEADALHGRILLEAGQPADALPLLNRFLLRHPDHADALTSRARVLTKLEKHDAALDDYRAALRHTPTLEPDLVCECADAMAARKCTKEAIQVLSAAMTKLGPIPSLVLRAMDLEIATGDYDAALARIETMRLSAPRPEPWMAKRASVLSQAGRIDESRAAWTALIDHLSNLPNLERGSHAMSQLMEQATKALTTLEKPPAKTR